MRFENSFEVGAPITETWAPLMDVPRVVPCLPGARLVDEETRRVNLAANAREQANRGTARAKITSTVTPMESGTRIDIGTNLQPSGTLARYGRGALEGVSAELTAEVAERLKVLLSAGENGTGSTAKPAPGLEPSDGAISGARPVLRAIAQRIRKLFGRNT